MRNSEKSWFLVSSVDIPPKSVRLGHIIADPKEPRYPINPKTVGPPEEDVNSVPDGEFHWKFSAGRVNMIGIWAQFLQFVGISAEAKFSLESGTVKEYGFKQMRTEWFAPNPTFVKESIEAREVKDFLDMAGLRKPLYLITGLKVVTGGTITISRSNKHSWGGKFGVDGTSALAPMAAGPEFEQSRSSGIEQNYKKESPIVIAYQLVRIRLKDGKASSAPHRKGAVFELGKTYDDAPVDLELWDISLEDTGKEEDSELIGSLGEVNILDSFDDGDGKEDTKLTYKVFVPKVAHDGDDGDDE